MAITGRPKIEIDCAQLEKLLQMYPTKKYVATFFDCSEDTVDRFIMREYNCTFAALRERAMEGAKRWLLSTAFRQAKRGSDIMTKFLLKNFNGLQENPEPEIDTGKTFRLKYNLDDETDSTIIDVDAENGPRQLESKTETNDTGGES